MYVQDGHTLETHDNVPKKIRDELYAEEQQSHKRHQKATRTSTASHALITITNVLLALPYKTSYLVSSQAGTLAPDMPSKHTPINHLNIPGLRDVLVKEYCAWQQLQVDDIAQKAEYEQAGQVILQERMDLGLIRRDPNPDFLIKKGVKRGIAEHVVGDIDYWVEVKRARTHS
jgi:hypothetical protein